jgi:hypothetical protein
MNGSVFPIAKAIGIAFGASACHRCDSDKDKENKQKHLSYGENKLGFTYHLLKGYPLLRHHALGDLLDGNDIQKNIDNH